MSESATQTLTQLVTDFAKSAREALISWDSLFQISAALLAAMLAWVLWRSMRNRLETWVDGWSDQAFMHQFFATLAGVVFPAFAVITLRVSAEAMLASGLAHNLLMGLSDLCVAWVVIRVISGLVPNRSLARGVGLVVWILAALHVMGLLEPLSAFLDGLSITLGETRISVLAVCKAALLAIILFQGAGLCSNFAEQRLATSRTISPSLRVLFSKGLKITLYAAALFIALSSVGIDLSSLAFFSGAIGVGIGFGLKTVFSNLVSGVILLMDRSIKPGDTIEMGGVFGVVRGMHSRYCSVLTRDGKEYLVPNERLIANEVVNWSYSDTSIRIKIPVGVAYSSDVKLALKLLVKATEGIPRILTNPGPAARFVGLGDNSVDLQLRIWIGDPENGVANVRSAVLERIWDLFAEHDIEFPFPQRDVLLKPDSRLRVVLDKDD